MKNENYNILLQKIWALFFLFTEVCRQLVLKEGIYQREETGDRNKSGIESALTTPWHIQIDANCHISGFRYFQDVGFVILTFACTKICICIALSTFYIFTSCYSLRRIYHIAIKIISGGNIIHMKNFSVVFSHYADDIQV